MSAPASADRSVRPAQRGDEAAIAPLQLASWRALMGEETLAAQGVSEESLARLWGRTLARPRPAGGTTLVALHGARIVGFALAGPDDAAAGCEPETDREGATQVYELVVDEDFRRCGHGSRMLSAIADLTRGQLRAWIGDSDEQRQRFFTSAGFVAWERAQHSTCGGRTATKGPPRRRGALI